MTPKIKIRKLKPADFSQGFFETLGHLSTVKGTSMAKAKAILNMISKNPVYHVFVAEFNGKIVGTATLLIEQKLFRQLAKVGHVENVATRQGFERMGIGSKLVLHAIGMAKKHGCYKVILDCKEKNVTFYERLGFRRNEISMRLDIA